jgi:hypothetical protein
MPKVFYRNPLHDYPMVVRGEGVYLCDADHAVDIERIAQK